MFPGFYLFDELFVSSYMLCTLAGVFAAFPPAIAGYKKRGGNDIDMIFMLMWAALGVIIGGHLLFGITNIQHWQLFFKPRPLKDFFIIFANIFGGQVFYGGLLGGLLAGGIYVKCAGIKLGLISDCTAPAVALFHAFGRVGCFFSGCCYGIESEHGVVFTQALVKSANGVPRVPVQLYEALFELAVFLVLWVLLRRGAFSGRLMLIYLITYSAGRFILEFWRGDEYRGFLFGLSTSQIISIGVFAVSAVIFIFSPKKQEAK